MLKLILVFVLCMSVLGKKEEQKKGDDFCPKLRNVLCVQNILREILYSNGILRNTVNEIEQLIIRYDPNEELLNNNIKSRKSAIESKLPKAKYHLQFANRSNIDQADLVNLVQEEANAYAYLYNSIKNVLKVGNEFEKSTERLFKQALTDIQENIICRYRSILNVYSASSTPISEVGGIEFAGSDKKGLWKSFLYNVHSVIIARLSREWADHAENFLNNVESKLS
ncbi:unnamed protein product [Adineta ricciae]|uniref:Uncharacterized protein n=1 Tax=Adineta ricciae TaxID=249248 RepID=A0A814QIZ2_ADIRI|nr:unnamed protein product [Adineta ricciae]CAF1120495.1 unnamed protein product [Adineta ricciae]